MLLLLRSTILFARSGESPPRWRLVWPSISGPPSSSGSICRTPSRFIRFGGNIPRSSKLSGPSPQRWRASFGAKHIAEEDGHIVAQGDSATFPFQKASNGCLIDAAAFPASPDAAASDTLRDKVCPQ